MADVNSRLLNIIKKTSAGNNTISSLVTFTVKTTNPLTLASSERLILPQEFFEFANFIDLTKITVGDKFKAISLNDGQLYYIIDIISSDKELDKYIQRIKRLEDRY